MTPLPARALRSVETGDAPPPDTLDALVTRWLAENEDRRDPPEMGPADEIVANLIFDAEIDLVWAFLRAATARATTDRQLAMLAAGPLEDLIARHGASVIDRVEHLARRAPRFRYLLSGVWPQGRRDTDIWRRIEAARRPGLARGIDSPAPFPGPEGLD